MSVAVRPQALHRHVVVKGRTRGSRPGLADLVNPRHSLLVNMKAVLLAQVSSLVKAAIIENAIGQLRWIRTFFGRFVAGL